MTIEELKRELHEYNSNFVLKGLCRNRYVLRYHGEKILKIGLDKECGWYVTLQGGEYDWYPVQDQTGSPVMDMVAFAGALQLITKLTR